MPGPRRAAGAGAGAGLTIGGMADDVSGPLSPERKELIDLGASTLGESGGVALSAGIAPVWKGAAFAGPAMTVSCADGDNLALHVAVARAAPGVVLAVSFAGDTVRGNWGEVMTTAAEVAGVTALVIDGAVRDVAAIEEHGFPVFARGVALTGAAKSGPGALQVPIELGGAVVRPGDWLVGDADGVVVIASERMTQVRAAAARRAEQEAGYFTALRAGSTTVDVLGLDASSVTGA
jgi:4-hydroxy-4-methyl-2-oxoglutarate aldolase